MLSGNLEKFNLLDVFQLLNMNRSVGRLEVVNGHKNLYQVYLQAGKVIHAQDERMKGTVVVEKVLRLRRGYFNFIPDQLSDQVTINKSIDLMILEIQARQDEMVRLKNSLPCPNDIILFNPEQASDCTLTPEEWKVIAQIDGKRSLQEIVEMTDDEVVTRQVLVKLIEQGLILTLSERYPWRSIVPFRIQSGKTGTSREFPPRLRTNILLKKVDGKQSLEELLARTRSERKEFFEDLFFLYDFKWIDFSRKDRARVMQLKNIL